MTTASDCTRSPYLCEELDDEISPSFMEEQASDKDSTATGSNFDCNICLEVSQEPVVTMCGHLFCWLCLHRWISIHSVQEECPVCKACVKDKIIPLYGRGKTGFDRKPFPTETHEFAIPRRPSALRQYSAAPRVARNGRFEYDDLSRRQVRGFIQEESVSASSVAAFGLFPALFGVHMVPSSNYNRETSSSTAANNPATFRTPAFLAMSSQQRQLNAQQEFVLYWCLILLAGFATVWFLLF